MIQVYTGCGKGKTTAALGLALRAAGADLKVYIAQFAKGRECSELKALKQIKKIEVEQFGTCRFIKKISAQDIAQANKGLAAVRKILNDKDYNMVILDEINVALHLGLIKIKDVMTIIKKTPASIELILTGRDAPNKILSSADLISDIKEVKHYFKKGMKARKGIEF